jgi:hypothetical protein
MKKKLMHLALAVGLFLLIPVFGNMYVEGWNWSPFDFVWAFCVLYGTGLAYFLVSRKAKTTTYKFATGVAVVTALLIVWMNGAVGIIGDGDNGMNLLYFGMLLIGLIGAAISRLEPLGLSRTAFTMAIIQMIIPTIALIYWKPYMTEEPGILGVFAINAVFSLFWSLSGILYRNARTPNI